ncbi:MAG: HNH endonuclease [Burkholderiales bacterium]
MATTPLERLLFLQGGLCFFCGQPLPKSEASVEHLQALANGGTNQDDNCVACCKAVNRALGSMPLKTKIQVVLNQRGAFKCPNGSTPVASPKTPPAKTVAASKPDMLALVTANLLSRKSAKPATVKTLTSTISAILKQHKSTESAAGLVEKLEASGMVLIANGKVAYVL